MRRIIPMIFAAALFAPTLPAHAQETIPLILDDSKPKVKVTKRRKEDVEAQKKKDEEAKLSPAIPAVAPEDIFVAVVDGRVMTKADLNQRVSSQYEPMREKVQSEIGGIVAQINSQELSPSLLLDVNKSESDDVLQEQKAMIEKAMRREEEVAVNEWVEHSILAEEARRQGMAVTDTEFKQRLADAETANKLAAADVDKVLKDFRLSHTDYEKYVYDALMIEKLLNRFIEMNYTEDQFKQVYLENTAYFREPEKFLTAHFTIALEGDESDKQVRAKKDVAGKVRDLLKKGEDPQKVFAMPEFNDLASGVQGGVPGYFSFKENMLPGEVQQAALSMKVGQVSDVIPDQERSDGKVIVKSFHVIKLLQEKPATGDTFESALPAIKRNMLLISKERLLARLYDAKTHRIIMNAGGIKPEKIPTRDDVLAAEAKAQPINLTMPKT